jgi:hypothetical protein
MKQIIGFLFLMTIPFLYSCKTTKIEPTSQLHHTDSIKSTIVSDSLEPLPKETQTPQIKQSNQWYSARIGIVMSSSDDEISGFIVNRRDSLLYLNINKFGIEIARVVLTKDTISMVNRFAKTYYRGDYSIVSKLYGISLTFDMIQSIFMAETFSGFTSNGKEFTSSDSTLSISIPRNTDSIHKIAINQQLTIDKSTNRIIKNRIKDIQTQQVASIGYHGYETIETFVFPNAYTIELPGMNVTITAKSAKANVPGPTSLNIPQKYTPMFP